MDKVNFTDLYKEARSEGFFRQNVGISVTSLTFETILFCILFFFLVSSDVFSLSYWGLVAMLGLSAFRFFALLHDSGHNAMFKTRSQNTMAGLFCSMFCLIPYFPWRDIHILHHKWVGIIDKDPTQVGLIKLREASLLKRNLFRLVWWLCIPIPSIQLIFFVFWIYPLKCLKNKKYDEAKKGLFSIFLCLTPHAIALIWLGITDYLYFVLPICLCFFFWFEVVNFTHHSGLFPYTSKTRSRPIPLHEQDTISRSSTFSKISSMFLCYNFNFHTEHHYFPSMPWHNLPKVNTLLKKYPENKDYTDVSFLGFSAYLRSKDPIDIYVKSQLNSEHKPE